MLSSGDRVRFTKNVKRRGQQFLNNELRTVVGIDDSKIIFDKGELVRLFAMAPLFPSISEWPQPVTPVKPRRSTKSSSACRFGRLARQTKHNFTSQCRAQGGPCTSLLIARWLSGMLSPERASGFPLGNSSTLTEQNRTSNQKRNWIGNWPSQSNGNKRKLMSDNVMRMPSRSLKEHFSKGSDAWKEHSDPIFRFWTEETGGAFRSLVSAPAGISATKGHCVIYWPVGTVVITGPKVLDFYAGFCAHRATCLKVDGKDIKVLYLILARPSPKRVIGDSVVNW
jgi:hypothetical protein